MDKKTRVAITGIGALTPLGRTFFQSWRALLAKRICTGPITRFDTSGLRWWHGAEITGLDPAQAVSKKDALRYDPFALYALIAAQEAVDDSGLSADALAPAGVVIGSGRGGISTLESAAIGRPSAYTMSGTTVSMAASLLAGRLGLSGHLGGVSCACASGTAALGEAFDLIRSGRQSIVLAGGAEAPLCLLAQKGYGIAGALSRRGRVIPFSPGRDGFLLGEGSVVLVLEEMESALKRGARIYAELAGYGNSLDAGHPTRPDPVGEARAMQQALADATMDAKDIGLIMAHATSTHLGDKAEAEAISDVFGSGEAAPLLCAAKASTGHMLAASGAFEAAAAAMSLEQGVVPPTAGALDTMETTDQEFSLSISREPASVSMHAAMSNSFGFGGVNTALVFRSI